MLIIFDNVDNENDIKKYLPPLETAHIYKLSDGTTLMTIQDPAGPRNVYVGGMESFDDLSESAQKAISAFYKQQGLLYDTQSELDTAYAEYLTCKESGTEYYERYITQDIAPTASNDNMKMYRCPKIDVGK